MPDDPILRGMNPAQREATTFEGPGPMLVLAGPGSGKTFVITQRIRYLLEYLEVAPEQILVLTFTRDAAASMKKRFLESSNSSQSVNFGTFHSVFYQILKQSSMIKDSQILTESDKKKLLFPVLKKVRPEMNYQEQNNAIQPVLEAISYYKNTGRAEDVMSKILPELQNRFDFICRLFEEARKNLGKLDFDDMLTDCKSLLTKNEPMRRYWQERFSHILIDEFQDINPAQYDVIKLLAAPPYNLFAVGDDDQAIYGFRGSDPSCMQRFAEEFRAKKVLLNINYRSVKPIVDASLKVIGENKNRFRKELKSDREMQKDCNVNVKAVINETGTAHKSTDVVNIRGFSSRQMQTEYVIGRCLESGEHAILFRTNRMMQRFALELRKAKIPFEMREKQRDPYEHEVVKDVLAYIKYAGDQADTNSLARVINRPSRYISREALTATSLHARDVQNELVRADAWDMRSGLTGSDACEERDLQNRSGKAICQYAAIEAISHYYRNRDFRCVEAMETLQKHLVRLGKLSPFTAVQYVRKMIGYEKYLEQRFLKDKESLEEGMEMLEWLTHEVERYDDVKEWLKEIQNGTALENKVQEKVGNNDEGLKNEKDWKDIRNEKNARRITLMTVHASKGLEFEHVMIPDCNERNFPHGQLMDGKVIEEERRLFYVGMTRARDRLELLYLTGTKKEPEIASRFLKKLVK